MVATGNESKRLWNAFGLAHSYVALLDLMQKTGEHWLHVEAAILPKTVLVQVGLQVTLAD
jgi:hypothetical protein